MERSWDEPSSKVASHLFWKRWRAQWAGVTGSGAVAIAVGVTIRQIVSDDWFITLVGGSVGGIVVWAVIYLFLWLAVVPRAQRDDAKRHIDALERKPTVELGTSLVPEADDFYLPVTNGGPCDVNLFCLANVAHFTCGGTAQRRVLNSFHVRWAGASGNLPDGASNAMPFKDKQSRRVHVMCFGSDVIGAKKEVRLLHANSAMNLEFHADCGTTVRVKVQAFGDPNLATVTKREFSLLVPPVSAPRKGSQGESVCA